MLPVVFHALWHHKLTVSLETPLHEQVLVGCPSKHSSGDAGDAG